MITFFPTVRNGNLRNSLEIKRWAEKNSIKIPVVLYQKFINLTLRSHEGSRADGSKLKDVETKEDIRRRSKEKDKNPQYNMKF